MLDVRNIYFVCKTILFILLFGLSFTVFAQAKEVELEQEGFSIKRHKVFFRLGYSTPRGEFSESETESNSGYAENGRQLEGGYEFRIKETIGIGVRYSNIRMGMDEGTYANQLNNELNRAIPGAAFRSNVQFDDYRIQSFLLSPNLYSKIGKNAFFMFYPTIGISSLVVGELRVTSTSGGGTIITVQNETSPENAFMFGAGGGFSFRTSEDISLKLFVDYLEADFENIFATAYSEIVGGPRQNVSASYSQKVQILSFGIEVSYNF